MKLKYTVFIWLLSVLAAGTKNVYAVENGVEVIMSVTDEAGGQITLKQGEMRRIKGTRIESGDERVVQIVRNGFIRAERPGTAVIRAGTGRQTRTVCTVTVEARVKDDFDLLRERIRSRLFPAAHDSAGKTAQALIAQTAEGAKKRLAAMNKSWLPGEKGLLWECGDGEADLYSWLRLMTLAFLYPGKFQYDPELYDAVLGGMKWMLDNEFTGGTYSAAAGNYLGNGVYPDGDPRMRKPAYGIRNWWQRDIGMPSLAAEIIILLYEYLPEDLTAEYARRIHLYSPVSTARVTPMNNSRDAMSEELLSFTKGNGGAANILDKCRIMMMQGIVAKNEGRIREAAAQALTDTTVSAVRNSFGDGYFADGSYIEHGLYPYAMSYGIEALNSLSLILYTLGGASINNKPVVLSRIHTDRLGSYLDNTFLPLIYKGVAMDNAAGRSISRGPNANFNRSSRVINAIFNLLPAMEPGRQERFYRYLKSWVIDRPELARNSTIVMNAALSALAANPDILPDPGPKNIFIRNWESRVYWRTDTFLFSVSANSSAVGNAPYEAINQENLLGVHTAEGMTYLYTADDPGQFTGAFWAAVDPQRLPGITMMRKDITRYVPQGFRSGQAGTANTLPNSRNVWTGGSVMDGAGAFGFAMDLSGASGNLDMNLRANKSWFMLGDTIVALGSGITGAQNVPVETTAESRKLPGKNHKALYNGKALPARPALFATDTGAWAFTASITPGAKTGLGYYFAPGQTILAGKTEHTGSWYNASRESSQDSVKAWYADLILVHGANPVNGAYEYALLPDRTEEETAAFAQNPSYLVLSQSPGCHAVYDKNLKLTAINTFSASEIILNNPLTGMVISVQGRASVLIREDNGMVKTGIMCPTGTDETISVKLPGILGAIASKDGTVSLSQKGRDVEISAGRFNAEGGARFNTWTAVFTVR